MALHLGRPATNFAAAGTQLPNLANAREVTWESSGGGAGAAVHLDLGDSPNFIRVTFGGECPSAAAQRELRESLRASGKLTAETRALLDLRELAPLGAADTLAPMRDGFVARVQAYVVATAEQHQLARQFRIAAGPGRVIEIFIDEKAALEWLWNADREW